MIGSKKQGNMDIEVVDSSLGGVCFDGCSQVTEPVLQLPVFNVSILQ